MNEPAPDPTAQPDTQASAKLLVAGGALLLLLALGAAWALRGPYQGPATREHPHCAPGVVFHFEGQSPDGEAFTYRDAVRALEKTQVRLDRQGAPKFGEAGVLLAFATNESGRFGRGRTLSQLDTGPLSERRRGTLSVDGIAFSTVVFGADLPFVGSLEVTLSVDGEEVVYPGLIGLELNGVSHFRLAKIGPGGS